MDFPRRRVPRRLLAQSNSVSKPIGPFSDIFKIIEEGNVGDLLSHLEKFPRDYLKINSKGASTLMAAVETSGEVSDAVTMISFLGTLSDIETVFLQKDNNSEDLLCYAAKSVSVKIFEAVFELVSESEEFDVNLTNKDTGGLIMLCLTKKRVFMINILNILLDYKPLLLDFNRTFLKLVQAAHYIYRTINKGMAIKLLPPLTKMSTYISQELVSSIVQKLLKAGAKPNYTDANRRNAFHFCAQYFEHFVLQALVDSIEQPHLQSFINMKDNVGRTPLLLLCESSRAQSCEFVLGARCARMIVDAGAEVNAIIPNTRFNAAITCLWHFRAAKANHTLGIMNVLIENNADVFFCSRWGFNAIYLAVVHHVYPALKLILDSVPNVVDHKTTPLLLACRHYVSDRRTGAISPEKWRDESIIELLVDYGAPLNEVLFSLCLPDGRKFGDNIFKCLARKGVNFDFHKRNKMPLIMYNVGELYHKKHLQFVVRHGANLDTTFQPAVCLNSRPHRILNFESLELYREHFGVPKNSFIYFCHLCMTRIQNKDKVFTCEDGENGCDIRICENCSMFSSRGIDNEMQSAGSLSVEDMVMRHSDPGICNYFSTMQSLLGRVMQKANTVEHLETLAAAGVSDSEICKKLSVEDLGRMGICPSEEAQHLVDVFRAIC